MTRLARRVSGLGLAGAMLFMGACSWFTDFKEQPKFDPWESQSDTIPFRANPQQSVSIYGTAAPGFEYSYRPLPAVIDSMKGIPNPHPPTAASLANGHKYFAIYCAVCHGYEAKGDGPATKYGMPGMNLATGPATGYTDGYIFGMIRNGRGLMPSYDRIEEADRWDIINYLRALQGKIPVQVPTGPLAPPGVNGNKVPGATETAPTVPSPYYHWNRVPNLLPGSDTTAPATTADTTARRNGGSL